MKANRRLFKGLRSIYKSKPKKLKKCARKEKSVFAGLFLENIKMFDEPYSNENADDYACMGAVGLDLECFPGWNNMCEGMKDVKKQHVDTEQVLWDLKRSMQTMGFIEKMEIRKSFCSVV